MRVTLGAAAALLLAAGAASPALAAIPDDAPGYVDVRPGAHMFYWLYGAMSPNRESMPWVLWLQGGPGAGGSGYGNFGEMGPKNLSLAPRATTWVQAATVVYVDSPVGSGFSYVDNPNLYTTNETQISADLLTFLVNITAQYPELSTLPFHIFSESYGGKMASCFSQYLLQAIAGGKIKLNFRGVELGDSWISGISYVNAWAPFLYSTSLLDAKQVAQMQPNMQKCNAAVQAGQWAQATNLWGAVEDDVETYTNGVNFYNIIDWTSSLDVEADGAFTAARSRLRLSPEARALVPEGVDADVVERLYQRHMSVYLGDPITSLMNGPVKQMLGSLIPKSE